MSKGNGTEKDRDKVRDEPSSLSRKHLGEGDLRLDKDRLMEAIKAEKVRKRKGGLDDDDTPSGKRKKHEIMSNGNSEVTEEELGKCRYTL